MSSVTPSPVYIHSQHRLCHFLFSLLSSPICAMFLALTMLSPRHSQSTWPFLAQACASCSLSWNLFCGSPHGWFVAMSACSLLIIEAGSGLHLKWSALPLCCVLLPILQWPLLYSSYPPFPLLMTSVRRALLVNLGSQKCIGCIEYFSLFTHIRPRAVRRRF